MSMNKKEWNVNRRNLPNAYFTVEAAMVMPMVIGIQILLLYLLIFQYNRCLTEQDIAALSVRANTLVGEDDWTLLERMKKGAQGIYQDKYTTWENQSPVMELKKNRIKIEQEGRLRFPFLNDEWSVENMWETNIAYEIKRVSPMKVVRNWRKLVGGD